LAWRAWEGEGKRGKKGGEVFRRACTLGLSSPPLSSPPLLFSSSPHLRVRVDRPKLDAAQAGGDHAVDGVAAAAADADDLDAGLAAWGEREGERERFE
jgi:hypothetical protein